MQKLKKTIALTLTGFSLWFPSWPPADCPLDGPIGSTIFCGLPTPLPKVCPLILQPVCGINGITYDNSCLASPVPIWHNGPCFQPQPTPIANPSPTPFPWFPTPIFPVTPYIPPQPKFGGSCDPNTGVCIPIVAPAF